MKTKLFFLFSIFFFWSVNAQIVDIFDANFKAKLLEANTTNTIAKDINGNPMIIDANGNGQIEVSEAENVSELYISSSKINYYLGILSFKNLQVLNCSFNDNTIFNSSSLNVSGLTKLKVLECMSSNLIALNIKGCTNLQTLNCRNNKLTSIDFQGCKNLQTFNCYANDITSLLNIQECTNLQLLNCSSNELTDLNTETLTKLQSLDCSTNLLTSLNTQGLLNLKNLYCYGNNLTTLNLQVLPNLQSLICHSNKLNSLNAQGLLDLEYLDCHNNLITTLDIQGLKKLQTLNCSRNKLTSIDLHESIILQTLDCYDNQLQILNLKNNRNKFNAFYLQFNYNQNLKYICCNEFDVKNIKSQAKSYGQNPEVNTYCSFNPEGNYNTIKGRISLDSDNDGCTDTDNALEFLKLKIINGTKTEYTTSYTQGIYTYYTQDTGNFTLTPILENPNYTVSSATVNFTNLNNIFTQNFCVTPIPNKNDLDIQIIPLSQARPGFNAEYQIVYKNKGTTVLSGNALFAFNDDKLNYISSDIVPNSTETGKLFFNFTDLKPFEEKTIKLTLKINPPTDAHFPVNGGDILSYSAQVFPIENDETPRDNTFALRQEVVNSLDPNDKTCLEGGVITPDLVGNDVHYLIRFENMGTANAVNVVVKDIIDTNKFDIESLQPVKSSHPYRMTITEGNKVEFFFENIQLPFDDANNDGYILFKIKTKPTLVVGDTFSNKADIYFDYNFPLATNQAITTVQNMLATKEVSKSEISIYPNPAKDVLNFKTSEKIRKAEIYDLNGRLLKVELGISNNQLNVSTLKTGNYLVKISTDKKSYQTKFIKQ